MRIRIYLLLGLLVIGSLLGVGVGLAQSGGGFTLDWFSVDGGGGTSGGGAFALSGAIGQPDAAGTMTGSDFTLAGGFWPGATGVTPASIKTVYLPVLLKAP